MFVSCDSQQAESLKGSFCINQISHMMISCVIAKQEVTTKMKIILAKFCATCDVYCGFVELNTKVCVDLLLMMHGC